MKINSKSVIKHLLLFLYIITATMTTATTALLWLNGYEKYFVFNQINESEALVYLAVGSISFLFTVYIFKYILDIMKMSHNQEIAHLG